MLILSFMLTWFVYTLAMSLAMYFVIIVGALAIQLIVTVFNTLFLYEDV